MILQKRIQFKTQEYIYSLQNPRNYDLIIFLHKHLNDRSKNVRMINFRNVWKFKIIESKYIYSIRHLIIFLIKMDAFKTISGTFVWLLSFTENIYLPQKNVNGVDLVEKRTQFYMSTFNKKKIKKKIFGLKISLLLHSATFR